MGVKCQIFSRLEFIFKLCQKNPTQNKATSLNTHTQRNEISTSKQQTQHDSQTSALDAVGFPGVIPACPSHLFVKFLEEEHGGDGQAAAREAKHLHRDLSKQENRERRCGKCFHSLGTQKGESRGSTLVAIQVSSIPPALHQTRAHLHGNPFPSPCACYAQLPQILPVSGAPGALSTTPAQAQRVGVSHRIPCLKVTTYAHSLLSI